MTDSQHKDLISKAIENSVTHEGLLKRRDRSIEGSFNTAMSNCFYKLEESIKQQYSDFDDISQNRDRVPHRIGGGDGWLRHKNNASNAFVELMKLHKDYINEENTIHRNERKAQTRALGFRIATTFFVGLTIMGIYAIAHWLDIPMPLMRTT